MQIYVLDHCMWMMLYLLRCLLHSLYFQFKCHVRGMPAAMKVSLEYLHVIGKRSNGAM